MKNILLLFFLLSPVKLILGAETWMAQDVCEAAKEKVLIKRLEYASRPIQDIEDIKNCSIDAKVLKNLFDACGHYSFAEIQRSADLDEICKDADDKCENGDSAPLRRYRAYRKDCGKLEQNLRTGTLKAIHKCLFSPGPKLRSLAQQAPRESTYQQSMSSNEIAYGITYRGESNGMLIIFTKNSPSITLDDRIFGPEEVFCCDGNPVIIGAGEHFPGCNAGVDTSSKSNNVKSSPVHEAGT